MSNQPGSPAPNQPFQQDGEWRSYDAAGRLLRWDDRMQTWLPIATPAAPPAYPGAPAYAASGVGGQGVTQFASLRTPALWIYIALGAGILATAVSVAGAAMQVSVLQDLQEPGPASSSLLDDAENADNTAALGAGLQFIAFVACAAVFIWWTRRATSNVTALGAAAPQFTPGWAVGWWFIPLANLVQPLRVIQQAWRASDPAAIRSGDPLAWKRAPVAAIVLTWWIAWIGTSLVSGIASTAYDQAEQLDALESAATAVLIAEIGTIAAAVLAIIVVRRLTQRQDVAHVLASQRG